MSHHDQEQARTPELSGSMPLYGDKKGLPPDGLVSIGVPVRNGGRTLRYALDSIVSQDYQNLEIIISDNDSTDDTAVIALEFQRRDTRIIYHRQSRFLTALENFRFVLDAAQGDYFMWAAHDDTRSPDYVSVLHRAMQRDPKPILSFGDLSYTDSIPGEWRETQYDFDNTNMRSLQRIRKAAHMSCAHFYGLWRTNALRRIRFYPCTWCPDVPIMVTAAYIGEFKYIPGPKFTCLAIPKDESRRAAYNDGSNTFNKYSSMFELIVATFKTSASAGGILVGMVAALFVTENHVRNLPGFVQRKLKRAIFR